jgi:ABC-type Mn2+/Zn2+ transport system ATPase subunit
MEAMTLPDRCLVFDDEGRKLSQIKYIPFNGLNPHVNELCEYLGLTNNRKQAWNNIKNYLQDFGNYRRNHNWSIEHYINSTEDRKRALGRWVKLSKGNVDDITEEFFSENYEISSEEMFSSQFASIFKLYQIRILENEFNEYLNEKKGQHNKVLSDEEFEKLYGPKPWELINRMLSKAGLTYQVNHPEGTNKELDFKLHLKDVNTGTEIQVNDLSTGEKVLMSLALSIYNTKEETARPDVLLIDEPDAALHPEFSKVLVSAIEESIVKEAKVKVIISTHSPMTVALSPEESIFLMDKQRSMPVKITKQQAVNILTKDLDNVRLSMENRRQVFVESQYDVQYYNRILPLVWAPLPTVPQFLPPKSSKGSNCDEVSSIVNSLRGLGNDLVYGIKDFDAKNHSNSYVLVLGENQRYAIDNYVFDPIYVAFLLVRENILKTETLDLPALSYVQLSQLDDAGVQKMIDYVVKSLGFDTGNSVTYTVQSGKQFKATQEYFLFRGHNLEDRIKDTWKPLNKQAQGGDNVLKNHVLDTVWTDYPEFISTDFIDLFVKIV